MGWEVGVSQGSLWKVDCSMRAQYMSTERWSFIMLHGEEGRKEKGRGQRGTGAETGL